VGKGDVKVGQVGDEDEVVEDQGTKVGERHFFPLFFLFIFQLFFRGRIGGCQENREDNAA
jgi:hypothetical protein